MIRITEIRLPIDHPTEALPAAVRRKLGLKKTAPVEISVFRRGFDARKRSAIVLVYTVDVTVAGDGAAHSKSAANGVSEAKLLERFASDPHVRAAPDVSYKPVATAPAGLAGPRASGGTRTSRPVVIGAGPCGLFATLILAEMGFRPILIERGRAVRQRTKDTWGLWRRGVLTPQSNVQFGEGGAGTFSDGKLYSGVKDPFHLGRKVLTEFVAAGAPEEILYVSKPHIGTFRLVTMVESMRAKIEALGGEYRFERQVTGFEIASEGKGQRQVRGIRLDTGEEITTDRIVLAVGHSARDTFEMLHAAGVHIEAKPFSIGVRIEHPQSVIDTARFGTAERHPLIGPADYKLVHHASNGRAVYSFCMCPGGKVVAAASEPGRLVTNGMSQYSRAEFNANAGFVVAIDPERDYPGDPLAGIAFQRRYEELAFAAGGGTYHAPAQLVGDFLARRPSTALGSVEPSYKPGVVPTDLALCLPDFAVDAMREALPAFAREIAGYDMADAVMTGVETRTSSPIRIRRDDTGQSLNTRGLFPAGEGAGYAGGILSAAIDGIKIAEAVALSITGGTGRGPLVRMGRDSVGQGWEG
ncbi:MAG: hypothetical protein SH859_06040 [Hyphomicrobium aestuarii]|nr:hypothetical protein [Hyphomicrobium aestuarii]